ncbi:hypothetical protein ABBQ38_003812 [Trebouxia sp. C0009 RCD-2024]
MCVCSNLTMKACRKLLEEDLGLPEKSLADRKEFIQRYVDKIIAHKASKQDNKHSDGTRKSSETAPRAKKRKAISKDDEDGSEPKAQPRTSVTIDKVKQICKAATIKIPPSAYVKTKSIQDVEQNLEDLLAKHGLCLDSSSHEINKTRDRLAKERDLEGIDTSNIVSGDRRARRAAAVAAPINYAAIDKSSSSDEQGSSSEGASDASGSEDEAEDMDEDSHEADTATDISPPSSSDTQKKSKKKMRSEDADSNSKQEGSQEVAPVKKRKAVIDDSDDD